MTLLAVLKARPSGRTKNSVVKNCLQKPHLLIFQGFILIFIRYILVTKKKYSFSLTSNDQSFFILRDDSDDVSFPFHCCCCCTLDASLVCFRRDSLGRLDADARESCEPVGELSLSPTLARGEPTDGLGC